MLIVESNRHRSASGGNPNAEHLGVRLTAILGRAIFNKHLDCLGDFPISVIKSREPE